MSNMQWTDIWHTPFRYDGFGYIWDKDNVMTFTVDMLTNENNLEMEEFCCNIVAALNGNGQVKKYPNLHIENGCDIFNGDELIGYFRGWGYLTGVLDLTKEQACEMQDQLIQYVMERIS